MGVHETNGWRIVAVGKDRVFIEKEGLPGQVIVAEEPNGFAASVWADDIRENPVAHCSATFKELEPA